MKAATGQAGRGPVARRPRYVYHHARIPGVLRATHHLRYFLRRCCRRPSNQEWAGRSPPRCTVSVVRPASGCRKGSWYPRGCQEARSKSERTLFPPHPTPTQYSVSIPRKVKEDRRQKEERALSAETQGQAQTNLDLLGTKQTPKFNEISDVVAVVVFFTYGKRRSPSCHSPLPWARLLLS
ncbi:hypothetical protein FA13DRAFT_169331 [Coprinellus micaceus]|uniref:Uncharacterized protein n=1 Tax=Coprinellus micaceus TaxID=71717 RepID=A0A4Y7SIS2_COPMI|nr:hypothetical protein FA13DRAFT_169331 [Coprinellus micaceus]